MVEIEGGEKKLKNDPAQETLSGMREKECIETVAGKKKKTASAESAC